MHELAEVINLDCGRFFSTHSVRKRQYDGENSLSSIITSQLSHGERTPGGRVKMHSYNEVVNSQGHVV